MLKLEAKFAKANWLLERLCLSECCFKSLQNDAFCFSEFKIFENAKFVVRKILERAALEKQTAAARANAQHSLQTLRGGRRPPTLTWGPPADRRRARARARAR